MSMIPEVTESITFSNLKGSSMVPKDNKYTKVKQPAKGNMGGIRRDFMEGKNHYDKDDPLNGTFGCS